MDPHGSTSPARKTRSRIAGLTAAILAAASLTVAPAVQVVGAAAPPSGCQLQSAKGAIQHVIYVQFDNTHFLRDNPNVPSDLEQMPNLLNFIKDNGTLLTNDHTVLISHTGGGILSSLTGLYPDRHGQAVSNSYNYFRADGSSGFSSTFKYWTDVTDGGNPANNPPTASADGNFNMVNADTTSLGGTGATRNAPAPWVPYTRAGCDVGNVGTANAVLENNTAIVLRSPANTLAADAAIGATHISVTTGASDPGLVAGQTIVFASGTATSELSTIAAVGAFVPSTPIDVTLTAALTKAHASGSAVAVAATDPTGDMTTVFGAGSDEWVEGRNSQIAQSNTAARALAQTDFVGIAIHCAAGGGICTGDDNAKPDPLPDEQGGYTGFQGLFGAKYVNPAINDGSTSVNDTSGNPIVDPFGQPGFPGFDGMYAKNTLGMVAQMQEHGVPVTFAYISDAHDFHGNSGNAHTAYGPGEAGYVQQLHDYDTAFGQFFNRLAGDGITKQNTLFVFTVEEGDHFAGTAPDAACDGVNTPCTYANGHVTEVNGDLKRMVAAYNAANGTTATTSFSVHSDMAPNVYVNTNPARDSALARDLERVVSRIEVTNPLHPANPAAKLMVAMADPIEEKVLHMVDGRPGPDTDLHAVRPGRLLPQRLVDRAVRLLDHDGVDGLRLPAEHGAATEPDVRLEPRRDPARSGVDVGRDHRARREEPWPGPLVLVGSHGPPADDARPDGSPRLIRLGWPGDDRVHRSQGHRAGAQGQPEHARGARPGLEADQRPVRRFRQGHADRVDGRAGERIGG